MERELFNFLFTILYSLNKKVFLKMENSLPEADLLPEADPLQVEPPVDKWNVTL